MPDISVSHSPPPRGAFFLIAITLFLNIAGITLILPVIPFLVGRYQQPELIGLTVGLIVSVYAFCAFLSAPVLGALSDRWGRRPILLLSLAGSAAGYVIFGLGGALWVLFLGRIIDGLTAGNISTIFAYIADTHPPESRGKVFGMLGAVVGIAFMFGPVAGGFLGAYSPTLPLYVAAAFSAAAGLWVWMALPESRRANPAPKAWNWRHLNPIGPLAEALRQGSLRRPFFVAFCFFFAGAMLQSNFAVYLNAVLHFGPSGIGWALFGVGVMDIVSQGVLSRYLLPRMGAQSLTRLGLTINAIGFGLIGCLVLVPSVTFLAVALFIFALGDGLFQPAMSEIISNAAPEEAQGQVQGANQAQQSLARMMGPLLAALLSPLVLSLPYWAGAAVALAGIVALLRRR